MAKKITFDEFFKDYRLNNVVSKIIKEESKLKDYDIKKIPINLLFQHNAKTIDPVIYSNIEILPESNKLKYSAYSYDPNCKDAGNQTCPCIQVCDHHTGKKCFLQIFCNHYPEDDEEKDWSCSHDK